MKDSVTTVTELKKLVHALIDEREWQQYHTLKDVAIAISLESSELLEHFLWQKQDLKWEELSVQKQQEIMFEAADVMITLINFCRQADIDIVQAVEIKLKEIEKKYPVERARSNAAKYHNL